MNDVIKITVCNTGIGKRLDAYLADKYPDITRSHIQNLIKKGLILVNDKSVKTGYKLAQNDEIIWEIEPAEELEIVARDIPLDIVFEDDDIIVVNKPQGMVVHPAVGHYDDTLVNALLYHCKNLSGINGVARPGIVHRIDMDTSGVLVVAKNDDAHIGLTDQWQGHNIKRVYHALCHGIIAENMGSIDAPIGRHPRDRKKMTVDPEKGRNAITHYKVLDRFAVANVTYVELTLETGRTHQIRTHMAYLGYPILSDPVYGRKKEKYKLDGQALHAKILGFAHPRTKEELLFDSPLPKYFEQLLHRFKAEDNRDESI